MAAAVDDGVGYQLAMHPMFLHSLSFLNAGSKPPKELAKEFLQKAEEVRSAALAAAVGREVEQAEHVSS